MILNVVGAVVALAGGIWLLVVAFQESILWGIGCLLVPCIGLIFAIMHWEKAKKPFLIELVGVALATVGSAMTKNIAG
jgi:hypothetical protein